MVVSSTRLRGAGRLGKTGAGSSIHSTHAGRLRNRSRNCSRRRAAAAIGAARRLSFAAPTDPSVCSNRKGLQRLSGSNSYAERQLFIDGIVERIWGLVGGVSWYWWPRTSRRVAQGPAAPDAHACRDDGLLWRDGKPNSGIPAFRKLDWRRAAWKSTGSRSPLDVQCRIWFIGVRFEATKWELLNEPTQYLVVPRPFWQQNIGLLLSGDPQNLPSAIPVAHISRHGAARDGAALAGDRDEMSDEALARALSMSRRGSFHGRTSRRRARVQRPRPHPRRGSGGWRTRPRPRLLRSPNYAASPPRSRPFRRDTDTGVRDTRPI